MEEERIKSALEIAMERISALPELTPEEIAAQKEKQYIPLGEAIAVKYLTGLIGDDELPAELEAYQGDQKQIVRRELEGDSASADRALKAMSRLAPAKSPLIMKAAKNFKAIVREFQQAQQNKASEFVASGLGAIAELGISGSAVRYNLKENEDWQEELRNLRPPFETKLEAIRATLLQEIQTV
jgi:hypothetical protein